MAHGRSPHRRRGAAIDARDGLTQDEPVLRVGEHQDDLGLDREVRERTVERMGQLVLHDRNGGDFFPRVRNRVPSWP